MSLTNVATERTTPSPTPDANTLHYLGVAVSCESRGTGYVVFEETRLRKEYRMLRVIFEHGKPLEAVQVVLESWHVIFYWHRPVLLLPLEDAALLGHGAALGVGYNEQLVRTRLAELREMAA